MNLQQHTNILLEGKHEKPVLVDVYYPANQQAKAIVVFAHGFKGFKDWGAWHLVAQHFAAANMVFVKFNFSHNGTTPNAPLDFGDLEAFGNNNFSIELDDLDVVIDWITSGAAQKYIPAEELNTEQIHLIGHSRGGGIAILKAHQDARIKSLITWAAVNQFGRHWAGAVVEEWKKTGVQYIRNGRTKQQMPLYWQLCENFLANKEKLDIPAAVRNFTKPFLIIHGTNDPAVPHKMATDMHEWNDNTQLVSIENGNHVFGMRHPYEEATLPADAQEVAAASVRFISKQVQS